MVAGRKVGAVATDSLPGSKALKPHALTPRRSAVVPVCRPGGIAERRFVGVREWQEGTGRREAPRLRTREKLCRVRNSKSAPA
jgi:hypothetical protein